MVENMGINVLVPFLVFGIMIFGGWYMANVALADVERRRQEEKGAKPAAGPQQ